MIGISKGQQATVEKNDFVKLLAVGSMVIDHLGAYFFPEALWMRMVGRLAFPVFAWYLVMGVDRTSNLGFYLGRLLLFGLAAQVPYWYMNGTPDLNILFTFLFGILMLMGRRLNSFFLTWVWLPAAIVFQVDYVYYGWFPYGLLFIYLLDVFREELKKGLGWFIGLHLLLWPEIWIQSLSLGALGLVGRPWSVRVILPRYFFYIFYPAHLAVLAMIKGYLS